MPERIRASLGKPDNPLFARAKTLGLTLRIRDIIPSTRRAHECAEYARAHDKLPAFHRGVLERYWSHGEDIHDWAVLGAVATAVGLDAAQMQTEVDAGHWRATTDAALAGAAQVGVRAVPTFLVADRIALSGAQEAEVFRQAFARLATPE